MSVGEDLDQLYEEGHRLRASGENEHAIDTFLRVHVLADAHRDHYHACGAAHMLGVMKTDWEEKLTWHQRALEHANQIHERPVESFYPSLYVNLGYVLANLGMLDQALEYYEKAQACEAVHEHENDEYGISLKRAIARGLEQLHRGEIPAPE